MNKKTVGEILNDLRRENGWDIQTGADKMGCSVDQLAQIENGVQIVPDGWLNKFETLYGPEVYGLDHNDPRCKLFRENRDPGPVFKDTAYFTREAREKLREALTCRLLPTNEEDPDFIFMSTAALAINNMHQEYIELQNELEAATDSTAKWHRQVIEKDAHINALLKALARVEDNSCLP